MDEFDPENLFNLDDFSSVEIIVQVRNRTSQTAVQGGKRLFGKDQGAPSEKVAQVRLMEFDEKSLSLDAPEKTASRGHLLLVSVEVKGIPSAFEFSLLAKVQETYPLEDQRMRLDLVIHESEHRGYEIFLDLFQDRQKEIENFIKSMAR
jgi:hypothetical protein